MFGWKGMQLLMLEHDLRESVELNPAPSSISDEKLELNIWKSLSLTGHEVKPNNLQACHRLKKKESVIVLLWNLNEGNLNRKYLLTGKISEINPKIYTSKNFLVSSSYWRACAMNTISWHINVANWRMWRKSTLLGFRIMQ